MRVSPPTIAVVKRKKKKKKKGTFTYFRPVILCLKQAVVCSGSQLDLLVSFDLFIHLFTLHFYTYCFLYGGWELLQLHLQFYVSTL